MNDQEVGAMPAPPLRRRLRDEISGSLGDLGTFLPHIIGAITVVGMAPTGILVGFGGFYVFSGLFYRLPMAVQPMKAVSAAVLIDPMEPGTVAAAGLVIGAMLVIAGFSGLIDRLARVVPMSVAAGLQLGLGLSLAALGLRMMATQPWLGAAIAVLILLTMHGRRLPAALTALAAGVAGGQFFGLAPPFPEITLGLHLPAPILPDWEQVLYATEHAVLPQLPLTLTNAIIVAAAVSRQFYGARAGRVTERNLAITQGFGNLLTAPFGGYLMCHGAGGIAAHYRFGARTAMAPLMLGGVFLALGLLLGDAGYALLKTVPDGALGALLLFSGVELALSARPQKYDQPDLFVILTMAALCVTFNPAAAFFVGLPLAWALKKGWIKL